MTRIRLLTSVVGDGPVFGDVGQILDVDSGTARAWADGERAELVLDQEHEHRDRRRTRTG